MAKHINQGGVITVDGVDLSEHVQSYDLPQTTEDHDVTGMSAQAREHALGISDDSITLNFWQDFDAGSVDSVLQPIYDAKQPVEVKIVKGPGAVSPTNPSWTMQGLLSNYTPLSGDAGAPAATEAAFLCGDQNGIVKAVAP